MFRTIWSRYQSRLHTHPYTTNGITTGVVIGLGDACAQYIERYNINDKTKQNSKDTLIPFNYNKVRGTIMFRYVVM